VAGVSPKLECAIDEGVSTLSALHLYPLKSARALAPGRWPLDALGLRFDRHWMVVDDAGNCLTQRTHPRLTLVGAVVDSDALTLDASGMGSLALPLDASGLSTRETQVWNHRGPSLDEGEEAARWISAHLGVSTRIVRIPPHHARRVNPAFFSGEAHTAFTDGYPLMLISEASLEALNARLALPLPMNRFRPNLVVRGCEAFAEDDWTRIRVGTIELAVVKPCDRCVITTTDQQTGLRDGKEPLATLATFRKRGDVVLFGQNCVSLGTGTLTVGDPIEVLETRPAV
jgi:uncharacterized protein YcbX